MGNSNTEHSVKLRRVTAKKHNAAKKSAGYKYPAVPLPPETIDLVTELAAIYGTKTNVYVTAINKLKESHKKA